MKLVPCFIPYGFIVNIIPTLHVMHVTAFHISHSTVPTKTTNRLEKTRINVSTHNPQDVLLATTATSSSYSSSSSSPGEADRALRQALSFEKAGFIRAAVACYHEAATLYQCFIDSNENDNSLVRGAFAHVTGYASPSSSTTTTTTTTKASNNNSATTSIPSAAKVLAYTCIKLASLSKDGLGDAKAAARLYRYATLVDSEPSSLAYDGMGTCIEGAGGKLHEAIAAYRQALRISPQDSLILFHLAVALERVGKNKSEAEEIMEQLRRSDASIACLVDSWGYVRWHTRRIPNTELNLHRGFRSMLQLGLDASKSLMSPTIKGLVCEFGVGNGRSLRLIQEMLPLEYPIHGFDTFTVTSGLPPSLEGEVYFYRGLFKDTIPTFVNSLSEEYRPFALANIDCDLYGSTLDILESMHSRVVPGTVFVFDKYLCHATWRTDEFR